MTNSKADSPMPVQTSWLETPKAPGRLIFSMTIPGRLPSWNDILGMEQWARYDFKNELAELAVTKLTPLAGEMRRLLADPAEIERILKAGAERAEAIAEPILADVKQLVGFLE